MTGKNKFVGGVKSENYNHGNKELEGDSRILATVLKNKMKYLGVIFHSKRSFIANFQ